MSTITNAMAIRFLPSGSDIASVGWCCAYNGATNDSFRDRTDGISQIRLSLSFEISDAKG